MRVFLDANIFISYLLGSDKEGAVSQTVEAGILGQYTLLVTRPLLDELAQAVRRKPYLAAHIPPTQLEHFRTLIVAVSEFVPEIEEPVPAVVSDPKDDYLLAHALVAEANYLVTGDADLLVLDPVGDLRILSPREFLPILVPSA